MKVKTYRNINLRSGEIIPENTEVDVRFQQGLTTCFITYKDKEYQVRITSVFEKPSQEELEEWSSDSIVESVLGNNVEPDGYDEHNAPSWLIVLGLI